MRVLKYELKLDDEGTDIALPRGSAPLSVGCKPGETVPSLWVRQPTREALPEMRRFRVIGTGQDVQAPLGEWHYIGTAITDATEGRSFVWHVFEVR